MKSKWEKFTTVYKAYVLSVQENRQLVIAMISLVCATTLLSFFTPVLSGLIIDAVERQSTPLLEYLCILSMVVLTVSAIVSLFQNHIVSKCITRVSYEMKKKAFRASLSRHSSFYDRFKFGEILFRIYNDTAVVAEKIILLPVNFLVSVAFLIIAVFSIALINKIVFLFVVAMLLANSLISVWLQKKGKHRSQSLQEKGEALYALSQDQLANVESIQLCCFAEKEASRNDAAMRGFAEQYYKKNVYFGNSGVALSVANSLWTTGILLIGGYAIVAKTMTLGDLVYCLMLMNILMPFCKNIQEFILYQSTYLMMLDRHNEIVHYPAIDFGKKSDTNPIRTGSVLISSVRFSYPGVEKTVFDNFSISIRPNVMTCIVGDSGIGKSTLLRLLIRKGEPNSGEIVVGGVNLSSISLVDLRSAIKYIDGNVSLFAGTFLDNIRYGCPECNYEDIDRAIEMSCLRGVVERMPDGIHTCIGKDGFSLSEGERQRVLIARSVLAKPVLLLLDEATSNVDPMTNKILFNNLRTILSNCTIIAVSHSKEIESYADDVIRLNDVEGVSNA